VVALLPGQGSGNRPCQDVVAVSRPEGDPQRGPGAGRVAEIDGRRAVIDRIDRGGGVLRLRRLEEEEGLARAGGEVQPGGETAGGEARRRRSVRSTRHICPFKSPT